MTTLQKIALAAFAAFLILGLLWLHSCQEARNAKTQADLAKGQAGAALQSGGDAVTTLGNRMEAEAVAAKEVQETKDAINNASDVAGVTDAGRAGLCRQSGRRC